MKKNHINKRTKKNPTESLKNRIKLLETKLAKEKVKSKKYDEYRGIIESLKMNTSASYSLLHVARLLNVGRSHLCLVLRDEKIFSSDGKYNFVYQYYIDKGYFITTNKITLAGFSVPVIRVTNKGLVWLLKKYNPLKKKSKYIPSKKTSKPRAKRSK